MSYATEAPDATEEYVNKAARDFIRALARIPGKHPAETKQNFSFNMNLLIYDEDDDNDE